MLAIRYPLKVRHWLTVKRTRNILACLSAVVAGYALVIPASHTWQRSAQHSSAENLTYIRERQHPCDKEAGKFLVYYSHGLFGSIVPFFVMILCTSLIVYLVCQTRRDLATTLEQLSARQTMMLRAAHRVAANAAVGDASRTCAADSTAGGVNNKPGGGEKRVTLVLVLMNLTYFLTNGFAGLFLISKVHLASTSDTEFARIWATFHRFADVCACLNNSTNWIFYLLTGRKFREQFLRVIRCHRPNEPQLPLQLRHQKLLPNLREGNHAKNGGDGDRGGRRGCLKQQPHQGNLDLIIVASVSNNQNQLAEPHGTIREADLISTV